MGIKQWISGLFRKKEIVIPKIWLTIEEASRTYGVPRGTISNWAGKGIFEARRFGKAWMVEEGSLIDAIEKRHWKPRRKAPLVEPGIEFGGVILTKEE